MSAPASRGSTGHSLLVVIDPAARRADGESVRIAKDVLSAGAPVKVCLPEGPEEVVRALARRGSRRPVVVGDDRALLRAVQSLHLRRELDDCALSVVPVGGSAALSVTRSLGVPGSPVAAARAVLDGVEQRLDLLVDDGGGVVLGPLRIRATGDSEARDAAGSAAAPTSGTVPVSGEPAAEAGGPDSGPDGPVAPTGDGGQRTPGPAALRTPGEPDGARWWTPPLRAWQSFVRTVRGPVPGAPPPAPAPTQAGQAGPAGRIGRTGRAEREIAPCQRLRVEADGVLLADPERPVELVSVSVAGGLANVLVRPRASADSVRVQAHAVTVSGVDRRYRAETVGTGGPVWARTWTVLPAALRLTVPVPGASAAGDRVSAR